MKLPRSHYFRQLRYRILWRKPSIKKAGGTCDPPHAPNRSIEIWPDLVGLDRLRVMIDESIHACLFDLDNDSVDEMSTSISAFLWRCGVRFKDE